MGPSRDPHGGDLGDRRRAGSQRCHRQRDAQFRARPRENLSSRWQRLPVHRGLSRQRSPDERRPQVCRRVLVVHARGGRRRGEGSHGPRLATQPIRVAITNRTATRGDCMSSCDSIGAGLGVVADMFAGSPSGSSAAAAPALATGAKNMFERCGHPDWSELGRTSTSDTEHLHERQGRSPSKVCLCCRYLSRPHDVGSGIVSGRRRFRGWDRERRLGNRGRHRERCRRCPLLVAFSSPMTAAGSDATRGVISSLTCAYELFFCSPSGRRAETVQ